MPPGRTGRSSTTASRLAASMRMPAQARRRDLRWFWSITVYVHPRAGVVTNGKVPTLEQAKAELQLNWIAWTKPTSREGSAVVPLASATGVFNFAQTRSGTVRYIFCHHRHRPEQASVAERPVALPPETGAPPNADHPIP
jgi:hypothetical protein